MAADLIHSHEAGESYGGAAENSQSGGGRFLFEPPQVDSKPRSSATATAPATDTNRRGQAESGRGAVPVSYRLLLEVRNSNVQVARLVRGYFALRWHLDDCDRLDAWLLRAARRRALASDDWRDIGRSLNRLSELSEPAREFRDDLTGFLRLRSDAQQQVEDAIKTRAGGVQAKDLRDKVVKMKHELEPVITNCRERAEDLLRRLGTDFEEIMRGIKDQDMRAPIDTGGEEQISRGKEKALSGLKDDENVNRGQAR